MALPFVQPFSIAVNTTKQKDIHVVNQQSPSKPPVPITEKATSEHPVEERPGDSISTSDHTNITLHLRRRRCLSIGYVSEDVFTLILAFLTVLLLHALVPIVCYYLLSQSRVL